MKELDAAARDLYLQALELPSDQIACFLEHACGNDTELQQRVQKLLIAPNVAGESDAPSSVNETRGMDTEVRNSDELPATSFQMVQQPGSKVGPYTLREQIGEGGMGAVWVASQSKPIKRKVAIKLIKAGMDSRQVLARFEAERQALAMMDHPNIARVIDGGMTEQGRPYFAMEYVKGVPLTEYCDEAKLSLRERLQLFVPICQAVQHAHQKGIIHRDLKPSNILVCLYDGVPVPKVIDFGLAKAMHYSLTEESIYTAHGMMIGTPLYMSPEQAEQNNLDIDTRADVYALGVILYELLTGSTPLEKAQMKEAAINEVLRLIKEVDPPKPSTRLSGSETLPSVAAQRGIEPAELTRSITGDLDWVVMKALEKDRSRRYETANGLAEDIQRHLADEPVSASPPSVRYRMRKFVRRNRAGAIAAGVTALALIIGVVGTTSGMVWALTEKRAADIARVAESSAKQEAIDNASAAKRDAARATAAEIKTADMLKQVKTERDAKDLALKEAEQLSEFLTSVLQSPDPARSGHEIKVVELLDRAAEKLDAELVDQPALQAKLQQTLGNTYFRLGILDKAIVLTEQALIFRRNAFGLEHRETISAMLTVARCYHAARRYDEAIALRTESLSRQIKLLGPNHPEVLSNRDGLAASYHQTGRHDEALKMREEIVEKCREQLGDEHSLTLQVANNLSVSYEAAGRMAEVVDLREALLESHKQKYGLEFPHTLVAMSNLANAYGKVGPLKEYLRLREEVVPLCRKVMGPEHPLTLSAINNLARAYVGQGRAEAGLELREELLALYKNVHGPEHEKTLSEMRKLAKLYHVTGKGEEALRLSEEVLSLQKKAQGRQQEKTLDATYDLAIFHNAAGRTEEAIKLCEEVLSLRRKNLGPKHSDTIRTMNSLADMYFENHTDQALALLVEVSSYNPEDSLLAVKVSALQAWFGQTEEFAGTRQRMLDWVMESQDAADCERVAKLACMHKIDDADIQRAVLELAHRAVAFWADNHVFLPWGQKAVGIAQYRSGQYDQAVDSLTRAATSAADLKSEFQRGLIQCSANLYRAMSLFQQGHADQARELLRSTKSKMKPYPADKQNPLAGQARLGDLSLWLACREAEQLINE